MRHWSKQILLLMAAGVFFSQGAWAWGNSSCNISGGAVGLTDDGTLVYSYAQLEAALGGPLPLLRHIGSARFSLSLRGQGTYYFYDMDRPLREHPYAEGLLSEGLLRLKYRSLSVETGYKILSWGEMIGPSVVDLANPRRLRDPAQLIKNDQKLASPMVYASFVHGLLGTIEGYYAPEPPAPRMPYRLDGYPVEQPKPLIGQEWGARWGRLFSGLDLKLLSLTHRSRLPQLTLVPDSADGHWTTGWPMMQTSGATASYAFDYVVLRGEAVTSVPQSDPDPAMKELPTTTVNQSTVAADLTLGNLLVGAQGQVIQPLKEILGVVAPEHWGGLYLQYHFDPPINLSFNGLLYKRTDSNDAFHRESLQLDLGEHTRFTVTWENFIADKEPLFLLLKKENRVLFDVTLLF